MYDISLKRKWDNHSALTYAREEGRDEGLAEGKAEGKHEQAVESARKILSKGYKKENICDILGLTMKEVEKL